MNETVPYPPPPSKSYLGDGAYVQIGIEEVVLTTENGVSVLNRIALGPTEIDALIRYLKENEIIR